MQEDPKTVLRGMLTQVGEGDDFVGHGEKDEGNYFQRLSGKRGSETLRCCTSSVGI